MKIFDIIEGRGRRIQRSLEGALSMREFRNDWYNKRCWLCPAKNGDEMQIHHIVALGYKYTKKRNMKHDDRRNFAWTCPVCHDRIHDRPTIVRGRRLGGLSLVDVLFAKYRWDRRYFDLDFLRDLSGDPKFGEDFCLIYPQFNDG